MNRDSKLVMALLAGAAMVAWSVYAHWRTNDRSDSDFAEHYADMQLDVLPEDAVLFVFGDATGPMGYYQYIENRRPDVALYNLQGLVYGKRLYDPFLPKENKVEVLEQLTDSTERALFFPMDFDIFPNRQGRIFGFLMEAVKDGTPGSTEIKRDIHAERNILPICCICNPLIAGSACGETGCYSSTGRYLGLIYFFGRSGTSQFNAGIVPPCRGELCQSHRHGDHTGRARE